MLQRVSAVGSLLALTLLGFASPSSGQQASSIAGLVSDTSGAVLPGVTVEASSPALIEKARTAVTDGEGRYNIVDLRPGTYTVTFSLTGFSTIRREGIQLTAGFTARVNAEMPIGALEETVTVTGASPLVDVQNVRQQTVVSDELLTTLPSGARALATLITLVPGMTGAADVGGGSGIYTSNTTYRNLFHGKGGVKFAYDGMRTNNMGASGATSYVMNGATAEETTVETGGVSAESTASGALINLVPKEGANTFRYEFFGTYTNDGLQSNNLTDELIARGLTTTNKAISVYDFNGTAGGPIQRDKLWFFLAGRLSGTKIQVPGVFFNATQGTPVYTPGDPAHRLEWLKSQAARFTWQATPRNKINMFADVQGFYVRGRGNFISPEAGTGYNFWPAGLAQATWSSPHTSRLLLEAGASLTKGPWHFPSPGDRFMHVDPADISILESSTGFRYNAPPSWVDWMTGDRYAQRASASYVTGSHAFKGGVQMEQGILSLARSINQDLNYTFLRGAPNRITQFATPYLTKDRFLEMAIYGQDHWTLNRFTFNYGLRYEYFYGWVADQDVSAGRFGPARSYDGVGSVPAWHDLNPRLGVSYDLFGNGRTALKASAGRYVESVATAIAGANNPINTSVNSVNRTWGDTDRDFAPDCDLLNPAANGECGAFDNQNFGRNNPSATRYADDVLRGFGARNSMWDLSAEVQHQLRPGVSVTGGYYRNWASHFRVTDNLETTPADFDPFCITAPIDSRLPGGGGYQVCGLADVSPAKFGRVSSLVTQASNYYTPDTRVSCDNNGSLSGSGGALVGAGGSCGVSDFFTASLHTRLSSGVQFGGGVDTGRTVIDACYVIDSPMQLVNCRVVRPFHSQTQVKLYGSYPLPLDIVVSGTFQNVAGPEIEALYPATNAEIVPSLHRNLSACGASTTCTATFTVPLVTPSTLFEDRRTQADLRVSKIFRLASNARLQVNLDVYNVFNASSVLGVNSNYGPQWQLPVAASLATEALLQGRMMQLGGQLTF